MDYAAYCRSFFAAHYVPIAFQDEHDNLTMVGFPDYVTVSVYQGLEIKRQSVEPSVQSVGDLGYFGVVRIRELEKGCLIIGPVFSTRVSEDMTRSFMKEHVIAHEHADSCLGFLNRIPQYTYSQFLNLVSFVHFTVNHEEVNLMEAISDSDPESIAVAHQEAVLKSRDDQRVHGTWLFEQQMLNYIRQGNPEGLQQFLLQSAQERELTEGIIGDSPLRQAKNILQGLISLVGKSAAVPGGMDVETVYQLMDKYGLECERQRTVEGVNTLQFQMLIDFSNRVAQSRMPAGYTPEVYACVQYINAHINEPICLDDVAEHIGRSRSYVTSRFRSELGTSVADYILHARIREAKSLLRFSKMTLSEISEYLCFSSQPHFQRLFKQETGRTPAAYRKEKQKA